MMIASGAMVALWMLRGVPRPGLVDALLMLTALPFYLLAMALGIRATRLQRSFSTTAGVRRQQALMNGIFVVGGVLVAVMLLLSTFQFGR